jgi:hypothetical protein
MGSLEGLFMRCQKEILCSIGCLVAALLLFSCSAFSHRQEVRSDKSQQCEARWYGSSSEDPQCYELQKLLSVAVGADDIVGIRAALEQGANVNGGYYQSLSALTAAASRGNILATLPRKHSILSRAGGIIDTWEPNSSEYGNPRNRLELLIWNFVFARSCDSLCSSCGRPHRSLFFLSRLSQRF